ncbi:MAG: DUF4955 domain-containing protein [Bacteroides sp.]|uniref:DUF4955 domain-containing protein n=1 Tax=Bacteroides sp. TaxID=29523 RepID=UPI002FC7E43C
MNIRKTIYFLLLSIGTVACQSGNSDPEPPEEGGGGGTEENATTCKAWNDFVAKNEQNVLLDFSYAGYDHGKSAPADVWTLGYKKYDITDYGAIPNDGKSDRDAFLKVLKAIGAISTTGASVHTPNARALIYFPEGEFTLYDSSDEVDPAKFSLSMRTGNIVLKGAGRDKTKIVMTDPSPINPAVGYAHVLLEFRHWTGFGSLTTVTSDAKKGSFSVQVASTAGLSAGQWVCLYLRNNDANLIANELQPYKAKSTMTNLISVGVQVEDIHQIKSIKDNIVTFAEPIMHEVDKQWKWEVRTYGYYENIGIEDLSFKGNVGKYTHLGWPSDSGYVPISIMRTVNSWMRRVDFESVSEAFTITLSANVSVYDINITGNRGHSAVRSFGSSRVFIGNVFDKANYINGNTIENAGQHHATGVSRPSMGTVIWNCEWGTETNFESHGTQPRASLFDACKGGFLRSHQGGDYSALPNHMQDLTLWNFNATNSPSGGNFKWWDDGGFLFMPPIIVGFHGVPISFEQAQVQLDADHGKSVEPLSLYTAQLNHRLGYIPAWLLALKSQR